MEAKLTIRWDGAVPGVAEGKLSLGAWLPTLAALHSALRYTASGILSEADAPNYGARGGRLRREAAFLDVRLAALDHGSLMPTFDVRVDVPGGRQIAMFNDLPDQVVEQFLNHVEWESNGRRSSFRVRQFLKSVPSGISSQEYRGNLSGSRERVVRIDDPVEFAPEPVVEAPFGLPGLRRFQGVVSEIGCRPDDYFVVLLTPDGMIRIPANEVGIERAFRLRNREVHATAVFSERGARLVRMNEVGAERRQESGVERARRLIGAWSETLESLRDDDVDEPIANEPPREEL